MKLRHPGLWLGIVSASLVVLMVWSDRHRNSPGPVSAAHAQEPELDGNGCVACHGQGAQGMAAACATCHADVQAEIVGKRGLHGRISNAPEQCGACHVEHQGRDFPLVADRSFALAGIPERNAYAHEGLEFHLTGRHATLACKECHELADVVVLPKGSKRFLGLDSTCTRCHEDVHHGKLPDCASCHGEEHPFAQVAKFVHTNAFPLAGAHAGPSCVECHPKDGPRSIEKDGAAARATATPPVRDRSCQECHASPHAPAFLAANAKVSCAGCHPTTHTSFAGSQALLTKAQHAASGFALVAPHADLACERCHAASSTSFREAHPGRKPEDCAACHADPHGGQFAGRGCLACHVRTKFEPSKFDLAAHAKTAFPLDRSHAAVPCSRCHAATQPIPDRLGEVARVFHGTESACASCHADAHQGFFDRTGAFTKAERERGCAACHDAGSFSTVEVAFDHAQRTGFALEGAHASATCTACHVPSPKADAFDRTFGRAVVGVTPASCHVCHADPHGGAFDTKGAPVKVDGRIDCARCHTTQRFAGAEARFDHALWTGYALEGAHEKVACSSCHEMRRDPGTKSVALAPARGTDCAACHTDVHVGQFAVAGKTDCARCHATSKSFDKVLFDHDRDSRFHLDEGHRKLDCGACHLRFPLETGESAIRYKPLGTACADCHDARRQVPR